MGKTKYKTKRSKGLNTNTAWTESDIDTLTTMYHAGFSNWDIAVALGRSSGAVTQRIYLLKLHKQPKRYETVSDTLTTQDVTYELSKELTTSTLKRWWTRLFGGADMGAQ